MGGSMVVVWRKFGSRLGNLVRSRQPPHIKAAVLVGAW